MAEKGIVVNGLVLRSNDYGENDKIVTVLTSERGKLTFCGKGVKSLRNKNRPSCRPFTYAEFVLNERNGYYTLSESSPKNMFPGLEKEIEAMYLAYYVCETADYVCMDGADEPEILQLALNTLYALSEKIRPYGEIKTVYETRLLHCVGTLAPFDGCSVCGGFDGGLYFKPSDGTVLCHKCLEESNGSGFVSLTDEAVKFVTYETVCEPKKIFGPYSPDKCASDIIENYITLSFNHSFASLKQYKAICEM